MGRSSKEQASQNRTKLLENASRLFRKYGVDNVSVADVMSSTGMTTGGFYKHFTSKDDLIQEAFALAFRQASDSWRKVSQRKPESSDLRANAIIRHYFRERPADQKCPMLAFAPHVSTDASNDASLDAYRKGTEQLFAQFVEHMGRSQAGDDADPMPEQEAKVLFAAMVGAGFLAQAMGEAEWLRSVQAAIKGAATQAS